MFAFFILFSSCEEDFHVDKPGKQMLVIHSLLTPGEPVKVEVSNTAFPYQEPLKKHIPANVDLFLKDDTGMQTGDFVFEDSMYILKNFIIRTGRHYSLQVSSDEYGMVSAESYVPLPVEVKGFDMEKGVDDNGVEVLHVRFKVAMMDTTQYLIIRHIVYKTVVTVQQDTVRYSDTVWIESRHPDFERVLPESAVRKVLFAKVSGGGNFDFYSYDGFYKNANVIYGKSEFQLIACSKEYYDYMRSKIAYHWNKPLNTPNVVVPISLYSNIRNGFGIFAGYTPETITREFK